MDESLPYESYFDDRVRVYRGPRVVVPRCQSGIAFTEWKYSLVEAFLVADQLNTFSQVTTSFHECTEDRIVCGSDVAMLVRTLAGFVGVYGPASSDDPTPISVEWLHSTWVIEESKRVAPYEFRIGSVWGEVIGPAHPIEKLRKDELPIITDSNDLVYRWDPHPPRGVSAKEHFLTLYDLLMAMTAGRPVRIECGERAYEKLAKLPGSRERRDPVTFALPGDVKASEQFITTVLQGRWYLSRSANLGQDEIETSTHVRGYVTHVEDPA